METPGSVGPYSSEKGSGPTNRTLALSARPRLQLRRGQDIHAGRSKETIYAPYVEHAPPDTTAAIFWLKSRDPANWRDAWQIENVTGKYVISDKPMTEAEWIKELAVLIDGGGAKDVTPLAVEDKSK